MLATIWPGSPYAFSRIPSGGLACESCLNFRRSNYRLTMTDLEPINFGNESAMKPRFLSLLLVACACASHSIHADPLIVGSDDDIELGDMDEPMSFGFDSVTVVSGGRLNVIGNTTFVVPGDIVINGTISFTPQGKAPNGDSGMDGSDGPDSQPTGQNVGSHGQLARTAPSWTSNEAPDFMRAPRLTLESDGAVIINGTIRLEPAFDGGDGGDGGSGGKGGLGISPLPERTEGGQGGGAGDGGGGGNGGHAGLESPVLRIVAQRIDVNPGAQLLLDNKGVGGDGGKGGDGGVGGRGGDGIESGDGGHGGRGGNAGSGGRGGGGGRGGTLELVADVINLLGHVSTRGGDGGPGGDAGKPGDGGAGGDAGPDAFNTALGMEGGRGGFAGNYVDFGYGGGDGGPGGYGGSIYLWPRQSLISAENFTQDGGIGGDGGAGAAAALGAGGAGGAPDGEKGEDSVLMPDGEKGEDGLKGRVYVRFLWASQGFWWVSQGSSTCVVPFAESVDGQIVRLAGQLCGGTCLSAFVQTGGEAPYELEFDYRWSSTSGTLTISLAGIPIHSLSAPSTLNDAFQTERVLITNPSLFGPFSQQMEVCVAGDESSAVQISNFGFAQSTTPVLTITLAPSGDSVEIEWPSEANASYQLQTRSSLVEGSWMDAGEPLDGTGDLISKIENLAGGEVEAYFRVVVLPVQ